MNDKRLARMAIEIAQGAALDDIADFACGIKRGNIKPLLWRDNYEQETDESFRARCLSVIDEIAEPEPERKHAAYYKPCPFNEVDVYRVLLLFNVTDPALQHAIKKLLVAGGRGGGKDISRDVQEVSDALERWQEMRKEEG